MYKSVGCDNELDGKTAIDRCGVCGGDGNTCSKIKATFKDSPAEAGIKGEGTSRYLFAWTVGFPLYFV